MSTPSTSHTAEHPVSSTFPIKASNDSVSSQIKGCFTSILLKKASKTPNGEFVRTYVSP
ncbi:hypothetical protein Csa_007341 [Cucumis sativus]|uniref:Uncharacterized protein n=1 Tax=Cucumis sativus TaxID=3659 RepID=A0A0A0M363_CUCSA|nr:hypothetical protein Csa_007341 [Cucumis sativus]